MEFKAQTAAPQEVVTVNAALWEESCKAACVVTEQIAKNRERGICQHEHDDNFSGCPGGMEG